MLESSVIRLFQVFDFFELKVLFSILSIILFLIGIFPYVRNILRRKTRPHAFTFLVWGVTQSIAVFGILRGEGGVGAIGPLVGTIVIIAIFLLSLRFGARDIKRIDSVFLTLALIGVILWLVLDNPLLAVLVVTLTDMLGYVPTFRKSFVDPSSETITTWVFAFLANLSAIVALEAYNALTVTYIGALAIANGGLVLLLLVRRRSAS